MSDVNVPSEDRLLGAYNACALLSCAPAIRGRGQEVVRAEAARYMELLKTHYPDLELTPRDPAEIILAERLQAVLADTREGPDG